MFVLHCEFKQWQPKAKKNIISNKKGVCNVKSNFLQNEEIYMSRGQDVWP